MDAVVHIPVGVVVERRKAVSPWADFTWQPVAVLSGMPDAVPWTIISENAGTTAFYAGPARIELHASCAANYRDNMSTGEAKLWVVLRPTEREQPFDVVCVTADGSEGEGFTSAGNDIVDSVPMPDAIRDLTDAFIAAHNIEQPFFKRTRDRANPDALGRRGKVDEIKE
ncbi:MAG: DUF3305 domain-containing protein [Xanthobacteraceae bacterium]